MELVFVLMDFKDPTVSSVQTLINMALSVTKVSIAAPSSPVYNLLSSKTLFVLQSELTDSGILSVKGLWGGLISYGFQQGLIHSPLKSMERLPLTSLGFGLGP